ncbi:MAG: Isopenicillin N epimerase [Phycisphaerae bacterium]|nr:Isopenicillin N epimerase [Phycisphaerae bacterium]
MTYQLSSYDEHHPEAYWSAVAAEFEVDRTLINLNNGGVSSSPRVVVEAMFRYWQEANRTPAHVLWNIQQPQREQVRGELAAWLGVDIEEIAMTRNASEGLQACLFGLPLSHGDEILTTDQDYPRMMWTLQQRERRDGIIVRTIPIPIPCYQLSQITDRFAAAITPRTRMILISHVMFMTGQIIPVREIAALGRKHDIPVIVDGSHALAHLDFRLADLDCEFYAAPLHKWLCAPHGTGMLYVRRERIADVWPLTAAPAEKDRDIRKFEEIGTHPEAPCLAISPALALHLAIGQARKQARLLELRHRWALPLAQLEQVRMHTSLEPGAAAGIATFEIVDQDPEKICNMLREHHRIHVVPITHPAFRGIRVTPQIYTSLEAVDHFVEVMLGLVSRL